MARINSKQKGARAERNLANELTRYGYKSRRKEVLGEDKTVDEERRHETVTKNGDRTRGHTCAYKALESVHSVFYGKVGA